MKVDRILWVSGGVGCFIILMCVVLSQFWLTEYSWWDIFCCVCNVLGYIANLAIVAAAIKYVSKKTLDINGIGKLRVRLMQNNIQDITNYISWRLYNGKNFHRGPVLEAFYKESSMECIGEPYPNYVDLSYDDQKTKLKETIIIDGKEFTFNVSQIRNIEELTEAFKWVLNEGREPDKEQLTEFYRQWYCNGTQEVKYPVHKIVIDFNGKYYSFVRDKADSVKSLVKAAQYIMNKGQPLDSKTLGEIYRQWYRPK